ncbi:RanBP2-type zinc finger protein [Zea mays]|nr:RanBP2-type zinc finger protein [Zea mays]
MRKCNTPRPANQGSKSDGLRGSKAKMPEGSWKCEQCNNINYPFRTKCNRPQCGAEKPSQTNNVNGSATDQDNQ